MFAINSGTISFISVATARSLQLISYQNNEAVALYNQGKYAEAVLLFKQAVSASKTFLNYQMAEVESPSTDVGPFVSLQVFPSQAARTCRLKSTMDESVYTKAFEVVVTLACKDEARQFACQGHCSLFSRLSTILIYNLALVYHALGLAYNDNDSRRSRDFLMIARDLYSFAYSIPQQEQDKEIIDASLLSLFVQAILNNLGRCYAFLDDAENSVVCFELLLRSIILSQQDLKVTGNSGDLEDRLSKEVHSIACFFNNTLFLVLKDPGFAPAA
ncbi:expressed tetratricopeptide repeat protein [Nitzschia inconspicua]|uniref:Expressed tetratricopeptide repeat protein n=1 Tax=Nitzschia inconspicua TaxID=303405 RepID=A0A9K3M0T5_9STRA|nr:expressed tetratricopeptide repeat protein [Nitzschia inconspicua]